MTAREKPLFSTTTRNAIIGLAGGGTAGTIVGIATEGLAVGGGTLIGIIFGITAGLTVDLLDRLCLRS